MRQVGSAEPCRSLDPIPDQLRRERVKKNLSQEAVGRKVRRRHQVIHAWERGNHEPSLRNLRNWCSALGFRLVLEPIEPANG